jgi:hypothetical protein
MRWSFQGVLFVLVPDIGKPKLVGWNWSLCLAKICDECAACDLNRLVATPFPNCTIDQPTP